jgi:hypothetical protein
MGSCACFMLFLSFFASWGFVWWAGLCDVAWGQSGGGVDVGCWAVFLSCCPHHIVIVPCHCPMFQQHGEKVGQGVLTMLFQNKQQQPTMNFGHH